MCSCFDREVSCRRAAQAALQEFIGRLPLGLIENGLAINQAVNFMSISTLESVSGFEYYLIMLKTKESQQF